MTETHTIENGVQNKIDIAVLKEKVDQHDEFIDKILNNHLPHIQKRLNSIEVKMAWYAGAIVVMGIAAQVVIQIILAMYK